MACGHAGHFTVNIFCFDHALLVIFMNRGFFCNNKTGSHLYCLCAKHHSCRKSTSICNSTGCNDRNGYRIYYLWYECHRRLGTDVSTGLHSLSDQCIRTATLHQLCQCHACHNRDHFDFGFFPHAHIFGRIAGAGCYYLNAFLHNYFCNLICFRIHQHEIYSKRLVGFFFCCLNLLTHPGSRCSTCSDNAESAGIGYRTGQFMCCDPCHTALNDRIFDSQKLCHSCFHSLCLNTLIFHIINDILNGKDLL